MSETIRILLAPQDYSCNSLKLPLNYSVTDEILVNISSYPAGHVHIHEILYNITGSGLDIPNAQQIYGLLYILTVVLSCSIYLKAGSIPNWVLLFLPLSKRLHSIYSLRLFNDCWTVFVSQVATLSLLEGYSSVACILFR